MSARITAAGLGLASIALGALWPRAAAEGPAAPPARVVVAGELLGHLEPCNCVEGMLGGLPRRLAAIARERQRGETLALDGGDLSGREVHPALLEKKTRAALELLSRGGVLVAVGEKDLRLGHRALLRAAEAAGATLLGANLWLAPAGGPRTRPFQPSRTLALGGRPAVVVALLDPELGDPTGELEVSDPAAAASAAFAGAPPGALRLVLFHGSAARARETLGATPGCDLLFAGHEAERPAPPERLGDAWLVETGRDARRLARVLLPAQEAGAFDVIPLDAHVPDEAWARERIDRFYAEVRGLPEPERTPTPAGGGFVGSAACADCHQAETATFQGTKHHGAQARIAARDPARADLPECVACHVVGAGYVGGFRSLAATPHLGEVGCESCHGVGGDHAAKGGGRGYGVLAGFPESWRPTCVGCHDPSNSPGFDFTAGLAKIKHWTR